MPDQPSTSNSSEMPTATTSSESQIYNASCHCGAFKYTVEISPPLEAASTSLTECNCSICERNGYLLTYVPDDKVAFEKGGLDDFKSYNFNTNRVAHYFCPTCGSSCVARSIDPEFFAGITIVNVRMLQGIDLAKIQKKPFDGKKM